MSNPLNITTASFGGLREVTTAPLWQYDYGQILEITGLDLPQAFEVHFSNSRKSGETITQIGTDSQVVIPDMYLTSGADIYAFIFLHDGLTDGETEYVIKIPVRERPEPSDIEPTPEQQDAITEAIAALNTAVTQTGQDVISADESASAAAQSATDAQKAATQAQGSATNASASATTASTEAATATTKASEAATSAANAASAKTAAETAETNAQAAQTASESAQASAESASQTATTKASEAAASAASVGEAAQTATSKAAEATQAAENAEAAQQAIENMTVSSQTLSAGSQATVTKTESEGIVNLAFGIPQGDPAPVEMVDASVRDWLDDHPEATTTVQDGAITPAKLSDVTSSIIGNKADAPITNSVMAHHHTGLSNPIEITAYGDEYSFGEVRYANAENHFREDQDSGDFGNGVTWVYGESGLTYNGTCTANSSKSVFNGRPLRKTMPAGNYKMICIVDFGNSTITKIIGGNPSTRMTVQIQDYQSHNISVINDAWISEGVHEYDFTIDFDAVICRYVQRAFDGDVYDNARVWIGVFPSDTVFKNTGIELQDGQSTQIVLPISNGYTSIDTMQYPSRIKCAMGVADYLNLMTAFITPEQFYGGEIPSTVDASEYLQDAVDYAGANGVKCLALGEYNTSTPIVFNTRKVAAEINKLVYTGEIAAIQISAKEIRLDVNGINSSADGIQMISNGGTKDASHCIINLLCGICNGDVVCFTGEDDTVTLGGGYNSYNKLTVQKGVSYNGSVIHIKATSGAAENHIYGGYVETSADAALKVLRYANWFYNFSIEHTAYRGILTCGDNVFSDFRTAENENHAHEEGRYFCKIVGDYTCRVTFRGRINNPIPSSFDLSDVVVPPEDYGNAVTGHLYGLLVASPVVIVQNYEGRMSTYYNDSAKYADMCFEYYYNFEKKLICKPAMYNSMLEITDATVDMNLKDVVNRLDILADTTITLSPSYCAEGVNRLIVKQDNGYYATILNDNGDTIFDGAVRGSGIYAINFYAKKVPFAPVPSRPDYKQYTYFFGKNSQALVEKLS